MKLHPALIALAAAAAFAGQAHAVVVVGTTAGAPTWNRPVENGAGAPIGPLSGAGTAVPFTALAFSVSASGVYAFISTTPAPVWDNYTFLYENSFSATSPLTNVLIGNDDLGLSIGTTSGFSYALTAGKTYHFVTTGFSNTDFGRYSSSITGNGDVLISAVPEPGSYALMAAGLAGLLFAARRRSAGKA